MPSKTMKAVVKPEQAPGMVPRGSGSVVRPQDALIKVPRYVHLRHRSAHLQMG